MTNSREYIVFTPVGDYHVHASSREAAKTLVFRLTYGRVDRDKMFVEVK